MNKNNEQSRTQRLIGFITYSVVMILFCATAMATMTCPPAPKCYHYKTDWPGCDLGWNCQSGQKCCDGWCLWGCTGECCGTTCCNSANCETCVDGQCVACGGDQSLSCCGGKECYSATFKKCCGDHACYYAENCCAKTCCSPAEGKACCGNSTSCYYPALQTCCGNSPCDKTAEKCCPGTEGCKQRCQVVDGEDCHGISTFCSGCSVDIYECEWNGTKKIYLNIIEKKCDPPGCSGDFNNTDALCYSEMTCVPFAVPLTHYECRPDEWGVLDCHLTPATKECAICVPDPEPGQEIRHMVRNCSCI
jgi:hypothetical protein